MFIFNNPAFFKVFKVVTIRSKTGNAPPLVRPSVTAGPCPESGALINFRLVK